MKRVALVLVLCSSGNGPRYVEGPVHVTGSDPYGLDRDGDGVGCD